MTTTITARPLFGQALTRREDVRFLRGEATYLDDIELPANGLHIAFVRSRSAHARLVDVDVRAAAALPGVVRVLTVGDLPNGSLPTPGAYAGTPITPAAHPIFAGDRVLYCGQIIAAVVAESRSLAEDGADLVDVIYDELAPLLDIRVALGSDIVINDCLPDNCYFNSVLGTGDVARAFKEAAVSVSRTFKMPRIAMAPMETRGAIAAWDRGMNVLTLWCSAQDVHRPRAHLSHALGITEDQVHVILPDVGGAFGQKQVLGSEVVATARAAMLTGRTVKWAEDRLENFATAPQGRGVEGDVELALSADGKMLAIRGTIYGDMGAFSFVNGPNAAHTTATLMTGMYAIPAAEIRTIGVATNKVPTNPYRGAGRPEAAFFVEQLVEMGARALKMDPIELRRHNLVPTEAFPYRTAIGLTLDSGAYQQLLDRAVDMADLPKLREEQTLARLEGRIYGIGTGMYLERTGGAWESAAASIEPDGRVVARTGSSSHGQGHETTFAQIACDVMGVPMERVVLRWRDSGDVPRGVGTFASRSMTMGGNALYAALNSVRSKATKLAAHMLGAPVATLVWGNECVRAADGASLSLAELGTAAYNPAQVPEGFELGLYCTGHFSSAYSYTAGVQITTVEVEKETGRITVGRIFAVDDAGNIVNPLLAEGQVIGGTAQGLGEALFEEVRYDESGRQLSSTFLEYDLMTAATMPYVEAEFQQTPSPLNPLGIKGIGEGGCCGAPAAVANALTDALASLGVTPPDIPFTEEKIWRVIQGAVAR